MKPDESTMDDDEDEERKKDKRTEPTRKQMKYKLYWL